VIPTAQLGTPLSMPGNLALGYSPPRRIRMHAVRSVTPGSSYDATWGDLLAVEFYACLVLLFLS